MANANGLERRAGFRAATVRERNAGNGSDWAAATAKATALNGEIAENGVTWVK